MSLSFYDASVASFLGTLKATGAVLDKGRAFAEEQGRSADDLVKLKLREDMLPFSFQIISVWHHSMGAIKGFHAGEFAPPPKMNDMTFDRCRALIDEAIEYLEAQSESEINALSGKPMVFKISGRELPFTCDNFLMDFSLPNFYFHATTTYTTLRIEGVPLGKMDYLGSMRMGH